MPVRAQVLLGLARRRVRGSREYGSSVNGSTIEKLMMRVFALAERIQVGGLQIRHELHVGFVDRLEAADRRAVEQLARSAIVSSSYVLGRHVEVLHDARQVAEADVDELDTLLFDVLDDLAGIVEHISSIRTVRCVLC